MFGVKDKVLLKKRQGLFIQRTGLWKGMTRSFHKAFQGSRLKGSPKRYLSPKQASRNHTYTDFQFITIKRRKQDYILKNK